MHNWVLNQTAHKISGFHWKAASHKYLPYHVTDNWKR